MGATLPVILLTIRLKMLVDLAGALLLELFALLPAALLAVLLAIHSFSRGPRRLQKCPLPYGDSLARRRHPNRSGGIRGPAIPGGQKARRINTRLLPRLP